MNRESQLQALKDAYIQARRVAHLSLEGYLNNSLYHRDFHKCQQLEDRARLALVNEIGEEGFTKWIMRRDAFRLIRLFLWFFIPSGVVLLLTVVMTGNK